MRRQIQRTNPFYEVPRFAFGFEHIKEGMRLLDYGCFNGHFGLALLKHKNVDYYGVDKNADAVKESSQYLRTSVVRDSLAFEDNFFDVVTIFEVLEHVHDQDFVLRELRRVLKPDGLLLASVPRRHLFSFLDPGNFKFVFPRLHRAYYTLKYSERAYLYRYVNNPNGLVGDVEKEKSWHQHFRESELEALLRRNAFEPIEVDGAGFFGALFDMVGLVIRPLRGVFSQRVRNWDDYTFHYKGLFCAARKRGDATG